MQGNNSSQIKTPIGFLVYLPAYKGKEVEEKVIDDEPDMNIEMASPLENRKVEQTPYYLSEA